MRLCPSAGPSVRNAYFQNPQKTRNFDFWGGGYVEGREEEKGGLWGGWGGDDEGDGKGLTRGEGRILHLA